MIPEIDLERLGGSEKPLSLYLLRLALIALLPAQLIHVILVNFGLFVRPHPTRVISPNMIVVKYVDTLLLTPWIETLLMVVVFAILRACRLPRRMLIGGSALAWAAFHSYAQQPWYGVGVFWPFVIFSAIFLKFDATSRNRAVVYTGAVHCLYNNLILVFEWDIFGLFKK